MFGFLKRGQSITRIAIDPPAPRPGRARLALVLILRNEARRISEWARFHLLAGVRHSHVCDNGCTDRTIPILRAVAGEAVAGEAVAVLPWDQKFCDGLRGNEIHNQVLAYAHATRNFGGDFRWMGYLDADEFLVPMRAGLDQALQGLAQCRNISPPWHMFGRSRHVSVPEGRILRNYTRRNPDPMRAVKGLRNFKMIVDPCHVTGLKVHQIETDGATDTCNDRGQRFTARTRESPAFHTAGNIQLNHNYSRSAKKLRSKIARGLNLTTPEADHLRRVRRKVAHIEAGEVEDRRALEFLARRGMAE